MPAEWEPHQATWLAWPDNRETWPRGLEPIQQFFARMVAAIAASELARVIVPDQATEDHARRLFAAARVPNQAIFHRFATNDAWCRDYGALFVRRTTGNAHLPPLLAVDWEYNAWGGKYPPYEADNAIPRQMADALGTPCVAGGMVLEGGSIDVDGQGLLLATKSCLLNPNRNALLSREQIECRLQMMLGVEKVLWLESGLVGDDTDGHVDQLARFVRPGRVVVAVATDPADPNYEPTQANARLLARMTGLNGERLEVVQLPMPPVRIVSSQPLPASYANFYLTNHSVLVPQYGNSNDERACEVLAAEFPERTVVRLDCSDVVEGLGAIHCLTLQVPKE